MPQFRAHPTNSLLTDRATRLASSPLLAGRTFSHVCSIVMPVPRRVGAFSLCHETDLL